MGEARLAKLPRLAEALAILLAHARRPSIEMLPLQAAMGRVLAEPIRAVRDRPACPLAAMDGYAVTEDASVEPGTFFVEIGASYPGAASLRTPGAGQTVRVTTGARLPSSALRVLIDEVVEVDGKMVRLIVGPGAKTHVRPAGSDFTAGQILVPAGARLSPAALMAAAAGEAEVGAVWRQPRIGILSIGDELGSNSSDAIPDSVSLPLAALATAWGGEVVRRRWTADALDVLGPAMDGLLGDCDIAVAIGGASGSERDNARAGARRLGAELLFQGVALKPGKPAWAAVRGDKLIVGLPGNPVAALVAARLLLVPAIAAMAPGSPETASAWRQAPVRNALGAGGERETIVQAEATPEGLVPLDRQDSASQGGLARLTALIRRAPHCPPAVPGDEVAYVMIEPG